MYYVVGTGKKLKTEPRFPLLHHLPTDRDTTAQLAGPASLVTPDTTAQKLCRGCRCVHFYIIILSDILKFSLSYIY
jgi:hypothetical protein